VVDDSLELRGTLVRFSTEARGWRARTHEGASMPLQEIDNWRGLTAALDSFLDRRADQTSSYDVIRARVTAEAELEMDARTYGDFPSEIAENVVERVTRLAVRMAEVRKLGIKPRERVTTDFAWPIEPVVVTSLFGKRIHPITKKYSAHEGLDLSAEAGQLITASARGTVISAEWAGGFGKRVEIQHPGNIITTYCHLSQFLVEPGTVVERGDPVGLAGSTGLSTGPHLHFELIRNGKPMDPLEELGAPEAKRPLAAR
jgi:murein DD-endopeptidase MepM/ murein hydrolase activator NlpD